MDDDEQERWELAQIRQQPSRVQPKRMGSVMRKLMTQRGYGQTEAVNQLHDAWREIVGQPLCSAARPGKISRGVLQVHADDSVTLHELHFRQQQILKALQERFPDAKLTRIRFSVGR